jgi:hypothetical protein
LDELPPPSLSAAAVLPPLHAARHNKRGHLLLKTQPQKIMTAGWHGTGPKIMTIDLDGWISVLAISTRGYGLDVEAVFSFFPAAASWTSLADEKPTEEGENYCFAPPRRRPKLGLCPICPPHPPPPRPKPFSTTTTKKKFEGFLMLLPPFKLW